MYKLKQESDKEEKENIKKRWIRQKLNKEIHCRNERGWGEINNKKIDEKENQESQGRDKKKKWSEN